MLALPGFFWLSKDHLEHSEWQEVIDTLQKLQGWGDSDLGLPKMWSKFLMKKTITCAWFSESIISTWLPKTHISTVKPTFGCRDSFLPSTFTRPFLLYLHFIDVRYFARAVALRVRQETVTRHAGVPAVVFRFVAVWPATIPVRARFCIVPALQAVVVSSVERRESRS